MKPLQRKRIIIISIIMAVVLVGVLIFIFFRSSTLRGCDPGFAPGSSGECEECKAGTFAGTNACLQCQPGYYSIDGASECTTCPVRTFASEPGSAECTTCPLGSTTYKEGSIKCRTCPEGSRGVEEGDCEECPAGTFSDARGSTECEPCAINTFSEKGALECTECPDGGYTASVGSANCEQCEEGEEYDPVEGGCTECGDGTYYEDGSCEPGYKNLKCGTEGVEVSGVSSVSECADACVAKNDSLENANLKYLGRIVDGFTRILSRNEMPIDQTYRGAQSIFDDGDNYNTKDARTLIKNNSTLEGLDDLTDAMVEYEIEFNTKSGMREDQKAKVAKFTQIINLLHAYRGTQLPFTKKTLEAKDNNWWFGNMTFLSENIVGFATDADTDERNQECHYITYDTLEGTCKLHSLEVENSGFVEKTRNILRGCTTPLNALRYICVRACDGNIAIDDPDNTWEDDDCAKITQSRIHVNEAIVTDFKLGYLPDILNNKVYPYYNIPGKVPYTGTQDETVTDHTLCKNKDGVITKFIRV